MSAGPIVLVVMPYCFLNLFITPSFKDSIGSEEDDDAMSLTQPPADKTGITRTPSKPNEQPKPVESIKDKDYGKPIAQPALEAVVQKIMNLTQKYPKKKDKVLDQYKSQFGITSEKFGPADIRTAEQGQFLTLLINEIDSTL